MTVERGERDAEMLGIGLAELGNLMGDFAGIVGCKMPVACVQKPQQRRRGGRPIARKRGRRRWHHIHGNVRGVSQGSRHVTPQGRRIETALPARWRGSLPSARAVRVRFR